MKKTTFTSKSPFSTLFVFTASGFALVAQANNGDMHTVVSEVGSQLNAVWQFAANLDREMLNHSLAENHTKDNNRWATWIRRETSRTNNMPVKLQQAEQNLSLLQFGIENAIRKDIAVGAVVASSIGKTQFVDNSRGKQSMQAFAFYTKKEWDNKLFGSFDMSYAKSRSKIDTETNFERSVTSFGVNVGKEFNFLESGMLVRPSVGVKLHTLSGANYKFNALDTEIKKLNVVSYRAGVAISKPVELGAIKLTPEIAINYIDSKHKDKFARTGNVQLEKQFGRHFKYEMGVSVKAGNWKVAVNTGLLNGSKVSKQRFAGAKVSYHW